jgi:hypothetical protein
LPDGYPRLPLHASSSHVVAGTHTTDTDFKGVASSLVEFSISLETGQWQILSPGFREENYTVVSNFFGGDDPSTVSTEQNTVISTVFDGLVSGKPGVTVGNVETYNPHPDKPGRGIRTVGRVPGLEGNRCRTAGCVQTRRTVTIAGDCPHFPPVTIAGDCPRFSVPVFLFR